MDPFQREFLRLAVKDYSDFKDLSFDEVVKSLKFGEQLRYTEQASLKDLPITPWKISPFKPLGSDMTAMILMMVNNHLIEALAQLDPYLDKYEAKIVNKIGHLRHGKKWGQFKQQMQSPLFEKRPIQALQVFEIANLLAKSNRQNMIIELGNGDPEDVIRVIVVMDDVGIYGFSLKSAAALRDVAQEDEDFIYGAPIGNSKESYLLFVTRDLKRALMLLFEVDTHIRVKSIEAPTDGLHRQAWKDITSKCVQCFRPTTQGCGLCKRVAYCGRACQIADWKAGHRKTCSYSYKAENCHQQ